MLKVLILSLLFSTIVFAGSFKINDKIGNFSLTDQFNKIHTINSEVSLFIVTFHKSTLSMMSDFLSSKSNDFLLKKGAVWIANISCEPMIITRVFTLPKLRDYKYDILLIFDENNTKFVEEEDKITLYFLENGMVKNIRFLSTKDELEGVFR